MYNMLESGGGFDVILKRRVLWDTVRILEAYLSVVVLSWHHDVTILSCGKRVLMQLKGLNVLEAVLSVLTVQYFYCLLFLEAESSAVTQVGTVWIQISSSLRLLS